MGTSKCENCFWYWGSPVACHSYDADIKDKEADYCVWWEPKLERAEDRRYEINEEEWN